MIKLRGMAEHRYGSTAIPKSYRSINVTSFSMLSIRILQLFQLINQCFLIFQESFYNLKTRKKLGCLSTNETVCPDSTPSLRQCVQIEPLSHLWTQTDKLNWQALSVTLHSGKVKEFTQSENKHFLKDSFCLNEEKIKMVADCGATCAKYMLCLFNFAFFVSSNLFFTKFNVIFFPDITR